MSGISILNDIIGETEDCYRINFIGFDRFNFPCSVDGYIEKGDVEIVSDRELLIPTTIYYQLCRWFDMSITRIEN